MKKIINKSLLLIIILLIVLIALLSTKGIETNKFNKFIIDKTSQKKNIKVDLDTIKFKINLKQLDLFIETRNPKIIYKNILVPVQNIKAYIDFNSLLKSDPKIKKINIIFNLQETMSMKDIKN